jgi:Domain of unknown function (DUF4159)
MPRCSRLSALARRCDYWDNHDVRCSLFIVLVGMLSGFSTDAPQSDARTPGHYSAPIRYDGRFTLVRLRWGADLPSTRGRFGLQDAWSHDYPRAEQNLSAIIRKLTYLDIHDDGNEILTLDDPDLFKYPIALMWEPGFWNLTDREAESFRAYLQKGGFAIFVNFDGTTQWANFEAQMHRVLPQGRLMPLDTSHQIFTAFFPINGIDARVDLMSHSRQSYYGFFECDDPSRRLLVVANFDKDVPESSERSSPGPFRFDASNKPYELGVNYVIYGLSH